MVTCPSFESLEGCIHRKVLVPNAELFLVEGCFISVSCDERIKLIVGSQKPLQFGLGFQCGEVFIGLKFSRVWLYAVCSEYSTAKYDFWAFICYNLCF